MKLECGVGLSVNYMFTKAMAQVEETDHGWGWRLASRVMVLVGSPFSATLDLLIHSILGAAKIVGGVVLGPINFIAKNCCGGGWECCDDLLLSSLKHIFIVFKTAVFIPVVSFTGAFSPGYARELSDIQYIFRGEPEPEPEPEIALNPEFKQ